MKKLCASMAAVATAVAVLSPATASAAAPTQPVQGMPIVIDGSGACTLGFNDHARGVSYTAAHCASQPGQRVRLMNPRTGELSDPVGTIKPSSNYKSFELGNDWAEIVWDRGVTMGANPYSGDTMLTLDQVKPGEEVCYHGETTHKRSNKVTCGSYVDRLEQSFVTNIKDGKPGDSGGPIWVKDRGFIGVVSAGSGSMEGTGTYMLFGGKAVQGEPVLWGSAPRDGADRDLLKMMLLQAKAAGIGDFGGGGDVISWPTTPIPETNTNSQAPAPQAPAPEPSPNDKSSKSSEKTDASSSNADAMSSEKSTGEIVLIVVSVLVTVLPIVLKLAQAFM